MDAELERLWDKAKGVTMTPEERDEQRILDVAANGNMSDPDITVDTTRIVHTVYREMSADKK